MLFSLCFTIIVGRGVGVQRPLLLSQKVEGEVKPLSSIHSLAMPNVQEFCVPLRSGPHDIAPANDGKSVWYTAQQSGKLGQLDPITGKTSQVSLGNGSAPHGVIVGPDGALGLQTVDLCECAC
jgi:streptogramin lyase